jgi:hypothetical protein
MGNEKNLVEEAMIQMKNLEEAVAQNAKGILASTMKSEIKELVKESLFEQEEEIDQPVDDVDTDTEVDDTEVDDVDMEDNELSMDTDNEEGDEDVIDLTQPDNEGNLPSDEEVLKVFQLLSPDDEVIVKKDGANISLKDNSTNKEYMIVQESDMEEEWNESDMDMYESEFYESDYDEVDETDADGEETIESIIERVFSEQEEDDNTDYNLDEMENEFYEDVYDSEEEPMEGETIYELEIGEDDSLDLSGLGDESYSEYDEEEEYPVMESKKSTKPKGVGMGKPKFKYDSKPNQGQGFKTKMKEGPKSVGTGKAKFTYKDGENLDGEFKVKPKTSKRGGETSEAARTLGNGSNFRKGGLPKPRAHSKVNNAISESQDRGELRLLREKNEEYRNALNVFRNKLNEVAVFNSNLAYATRLFTEHTTTKQEKINILRRFDSVETIKESKNLYQSIKNELSNSNVSSKSINESVERTIERTPSTGSAVTLIESKTYENPQFLRMKDLMDKIKK